MDIKSVVLNQLTNTNGLYSLMIQNHLYGCFIIMEDIAQNKFEVNGTVFSTPKFSFDSDKQFSEIGLRYGFVMDTKLALTTFNPEYKEMWLKQFNAVNVAKNIEDVDKIEDEIIEVIRSIVSPEDSFFFNALDTGSLPQEWIATVLNLLKHVTPTTPVNPVDTVDTVDPVTLVTPEKDIELEKTAISVAITEKPIKRKGKTRRNKPIPVKKPLSKTRRNA